MIAESQQALQKIAPYIIQTPLIFSRPLSSLLNRPVYLKLESLQVTGSFKTRPAFYSILKHIDRAKKFGVITSSSGNFAQAVAYAGRELGVKTTIVMMSDASAYKRAKTLSYGAEVVDCGTSFESRKETVEKLKKERPEALEVHPFDSLDTITGDSTCGLEIIRELQQEGVTQPITLICPCSGGGLVTGIASVLKSFRSTNQIFAAQPIANGSMARSLSEGKRVNVGKVNTVADALIASIPGEKAFELAQEFLSGCLLLEENELGEAADFLMNEHKLVVEPGGAAAVAALLSPRIRSLELRSADSTTPLVCVVSGGNSAKLAR
jgi:threonine dehydratase